MISRFALAAFLGLSLVGRPAAQRGRQAEAPSVSPDTSLTQCWSPADEIAPKDRAGCERHRDYVMSAWRSHSSYYALLEIVEGRLGREDLPEKIRMEEVIDLLGTKSLDLDYPNSRRDGFLVWGSDRSIVEGGHLVIQFDKRGIAQSYYWVSE
jgi:hypothetical protein